MGSGEVHVEFHGGSYRSGGNDQLRSRFETDLKMKSKAEDMFLLSLRTPDNPEKDRSTVDKRDKLNDKTSE
jgi:hypothetical protein